MEFSELEKGKSYQLCDNTGREIVSIEPAQFDPDKAWELWVMDPWESWLVFGPFYDLTELAEKLADFVKKGHPHPECQIAVKFMDWEEATGRVTG